MLLKYCFIKPRLKVCLGFVRGFMKFNKTVFKKQENKRLFDMDLKSLGTVRKDSIPGSPINMLNLLGETNC